MLLPERLNDRFESQIIRAQKSEKSPDLPTLVDHTSGDDHEVNALIALAYRLQSSPSMQIDPDFARRLEERILARNTALHSKQPARTLGSLLLPRPLHTRFAFKALLSLCILLLLLGTGVLVTAAQVTKPSNPLYIVKRWVQDVQFTLGDSSATRAELDLRFARDRLNALGGLADPAHAEAYRQELMELDQATSVAAKDIYALPAGLDRDYLTSEFAALKADGCHTLRGLLLHLALPERLATTDELGRLNDTVPRLSGAVIALPAHPNEQATISITGSDLQSAAQLLVNGQLVPTSSGSLQNNVYVFMTNWSGEQRPQSIGILNPDGTAAQTTVFVLKISGGNSNDRGNGNNKGNGGSSGKGKGGGSNSKGGVNPGSASPTHCSFAKLRSKNTFLCKLDGN